VNATSGGTAIERLKLPRLDRVIYFAPALFFAYLTALCAGLVLTSLFLVRVRDPAAIAGAGIFGMLLSSGLGALLLRAQLNDLRYTRVATQADAQTNYATVFEIIGAAGWVITRSESGELIDARVSDSLLSRGEWVAVRFRDRDVWIASICDPRIGFSLVARKRCRQYKELIKAALCAAA
jgi:xanthosine utilization system XapX-like protein